MRPGSRLGAEPEQMNIGPTLTPNAFFKEKSTDVLDEMHRRLIITVNCKGEFQKWPL
jgi:hypothetical protein